MSICCNYTSGAILLPLQVWTGERSLPNKSKYRTRNPTWLFTRVNRLAQGKIYSKRHCGHRFNQLILGMTQAMSISKGHNIHMIPLYFAGEVTLRITLKDAILPSHLYKSCHTNQSDAEALCCEIPFSTATGAEQMSDAHRWHCTRDQNGHVSKLGTLLGTRILVKQLLGTWKVSRAPVKFDTKPSFWKPNGKWAASEKKCHFKDVLRKWNPPAETAMLPHDPHVLRKSLSL